MGMKRCLFNIFLFFAITSSYPAAAELPPFDFKGVYECKFSSMPIGRIGIEAEQSAGSYAITADIAAVGVARLFTRHSSHSTVSGGGEDFSYAEIVYETHYRTKDKKRYVRMEQKDGDFTEEDVRPPDNRAVRPAVSTEAKKGAYDPLSFTMALRRKTWEAVQSDTPHFSLNVYDGRRLMQVNAAVADRRVIRLGERKVATIRVAVRRKPMAGFTLSEMKDYDPEEPTLWIYYSDDGQFKPLYLEMGFLFGKLTATLAKECRTGESCLLGIKE